MTILGLDLSLTQTGVAVNGSAAIIKTPINKYANNESRLIAIRNAIFSILQLHNVSHVYLEGYSFGSTVGRERLGELGGVIRVMLQEEHIPFTEVPPTTLKMFATGHGNAKKPEVISAARERLGYDGFNDNEADALWLEALGRQICGNPVIELPQKNLRAVGKLQTR